MATAVSSSLSLSSSSAFTEVKATARQSALASPQCVSLPTLPPPPVQSQSRISKTSAYCRKIARNVKAMATGDIPAASSAPTQVVEEESQETPELLKKVQETWDKVEDKYAVSSLAVAGTVALVASSGMISAIDKLPLVPGLLELVGIGYTGWFAYKNLIFTPDREALIKKVKDTYQNIVGSS
ncbi:protein CURVATURE THYLAKOID 1B, chloroplastic [Silene latifolia]|uniref:protein CURVATURE THYLAKOID 1B, chloroplastic n=1 Tax=Silene latifolia TaxID=37657 RepID=UPI003D780138